MPIDDGNSRPRYVRLCEWRDRLGMSNAQIAAAMDVADSTICRHLLGRSHNPATLDAIEVALREHAMAQLDN